MNFCGVFCTKLKLLKFLGTYLIRNPINSKATLKKITENHQPLQVYYILHHVLYNQ